MARVRVHQHVNPFSPYYTQSPEPIDWADAFDDTSLPVHLDIGCARGRFILKMAEAMPDWNFLGVEIREPLVHEANRLAAEAGRFNLHYTFCNAMLWLGQILTELPNEKLQVVTIQFPDPWFKKKHAKRRMVNEDLVTSVVDKLAANGEIFVQTDIESLAEEMFDHFKKDVRLSFTEIENNPFHVKTEREKAVEDKNLPVYRALFRKLL